MGTLCLECGCTASKEIGENGIVYYKNIPVKNRYEGECPVCGGNVAIIDEEIMWHIYHLNKGPYTTYHSCAGHYTSNNHDMYVALSADTMDAARDLLEYFKNTNHKILHIEDNKTIYDMKTGKGTPGFIIRNKDWREVLKDDSSYKFLNDKHAERKRIFLTELKNLVIHLCIEKNDSKLKKGAPCNETKVLFHHSS